MKTGCPTINQLIGLLEKAKRQHGGTRRVMVFDRNRDQIVPKGFDEGTVMRGSHQFEFISFSEEPQP